MTYRLLLVENDPGDARLFREMLRDHGHVDDDVDHVVSVAAAREQLERHRYDVVFLDLGLPDAQGLEALDAVLASGADVPVVVLSGQTDERLGIRAVAAGAHDCLVKGHVHGEVLARVIHYAVSRHSAIVAARQASARAAAAEARLEATQASRAELEREVVQRREAQQGLERTLARLQAMRSIDRAIIANVDVAPMLHAVLHEGASLLQADAAAILVADAEAGTLERVAQYGAPLFASEAGPVAWDDPIVEAAQLHGAATLDLDGAIPPAGGRAARLWRAGFRAYRALPLVARDELLGMLEIASFRRLPAGPDWRAFASGLADQAVVAIESDRLQTRLVRATVDLASAYDTTLVGWSRALDLRDRETEGHSRRVTVASVALARVLGLGEEAVAHVRHGALLHDIGKMGVPDRILHKRGPLDQEEWAVMRQHTTFARDLLSPIAFLRPAIPIPYGHHERWDGSGYPEGLAGDAIPLEARLFAVADVFDALTSDRRYRRAWSVDQALTYIEAGAGSSFDPEVVRAFLDVQAQRRARLS
jgi:response regulator RpfG family c-di-GMP phosphodiesterase